MVFKKSFHFYDTLFQAKGKDYAAEARKLHEILADYSVCEGQKLTLLEVACGTGQHTRFLTDKYIVTGLDIDSNILKVAGQKNPSTVFIEGDMCDFNLEQYFDIIVCLFGSIAYAETKHKMRQSIQSMAKHLKENGTLIVEPWITSERFEEKTPYASFIDESELKVARMNVNFFEDGKPIIEFHYLVADPSGVKYFVERHKTGFFSIEDLEAEMIQCGLDVSFHKEGVNGRGLLIGRQN